MATPHVLICQQSIWTGKITKVPWKFSAKFPAKCKLFQKFKEDFGNDSNIGYILEVDLSYPKHQQKIHNDPLFLPETKKNDKYQKRVSNMYDKKNYVIHIKSLKQALDFGLILKVCRVIEFSQEAWLKPYSYNTELRNKDQI